MKGKATYHSKLSEEENRAFIWERNHYGHMTAIQICEELGLNLITPTPDHEHIFYYFSFLR